MTYDYKTSQYHADYSANATPAILQTEMARIYNNFSDVDGSYIHAATIADTALVNNPVIARGETIPDCKTSSTGLTFTVPSSTLAATIAAGVAYISGTRVSMSATAKTFTQSKDTYVDLNTSGTYTYTEVANNAAEPALSANNIRLLKVVTSTVITAVENLALIAPTYTRCGKYHKENIRLYWKDADEIYISAGVISIWNKARTKYVVCENTSATAVAVPAADLTASAIHYVYAIPTYNSGFSIVASTTAPTTAVNHPNYPYSRCLGSFLTDGSKNILSFMYINDVNIPTATTTVRAKADLTESSTFTDLSLSTTTHISSKTKVVRLAVFIDNDSTNGDTDFFIIPKGSAVTSAMKFSVADGASGTVGATTIIDVPVGTDSDVSYRIDVNGSGGSNTAKVRIDLLGYIEALDE